MRTKMDSYEVGLLSLLLLCVFFLGWMYYRDHKPAVPMDHIICNGNECISPGD